MKRLSNFFERGINFVENIKKGDKVLIIYHKDLDGIVSAAILLKTFKKLGLKAAKILPFSNEEIEKILGAIKDFDKTIILDIDVSHLKQKFMTLKKEMFIIDHHPPRKDINSRKIVYINPRLKYPKLYQPASYVIYKLMSKITNIKDSEWLAALGTIGDYGFEDCKDLIKKWVKIKRRRSIPKTGMWRIVEKVNGIIGQLGFGKTLAMLSSLESLEKLKKNERIEKVYESYAKKLKKYEKIFYRNARKIKDVNLVISEVEIEHRSLASLLSTKLSGRHPDKVLVLMRKINGKYAVNARYYESEMHIGMDIGKIVEKCARGLNGGGGHTHAAGATILAKNKKIFEERMIKELKDFFGKKR